MAVRRGAPHEADAARPSRRRTATRARLVVAAEQLFAERGTLNLTVEALCERAGFTRGAFYSNFTSVDDVFLTGYTRRSLDLQQALEAAIDRATGSAAAPGSVQEIVDLVLTALPVEPTWNAIRAGLLSRTPRDAHITEVLRAQADHARTQLERLLTAGVPRIGRVPMTDPSTLARAVLAADAGTQMQGALFEDADAVRSTAITGVLLGLTRAAEDLAARR